MLKICTQGDFLGDPAVKISPSSAPLTVGSVVENHPASSLHKASISGPGRSHLPQSNEAREPQLLKPSGPRACAPKQEKQLQRDAHTPARQQPPLAASRENLWAAVKTQCSPK